MLVMLDSRKLSIKWRWFRYRVIEHLPDGQQRESGAFRSIDAAVRRVMELLGRSDLATYVFVVFAKVCGKNNASTDRPAIRGIPWAC
jgi:hypothetical protein